MADVIIPISLSEVSEKLKQKCELLSIKFKSLFANQEPEFFARAPGRVNLIGEHIDYCGYSVLPMAIDQSILIAASANNQSKLIITNYESEQFNNIETDTIDFEINKTAPKWHDYFLSGYKGTLDQFDLKKPLGMNICLLGDVPKSAGLSSSSALVVCAALATVFINKLEITKTKLAERCAISERYVGTQGGGMDQAISCLADSGSAKLIDFNPLKVTDVTLPSGSIFVITNCCVEANKAATNYFNTRVVECRLASQVLAKLNGKIADWRQIKKPLDLQKALNKNLVELIDLVKATLHQDPYKVDEICQILQTSHDELVSLSLTPNTAEVKEFQLYNRALHVFSEAQRVYDFKNVCSLDDSNNNTYSKATRLAQLGKLMNESHESCKSFYDCSCKELDELTNICRVSGALGSRLTGAGWGGCAVSLLPDQDSLNDFLDKLKQLYYSKDERLSALFTSSAFATQPSSGIQIILP